MRWTVVQVAEALGVPAPAGLDAVAGLAGVSIDSRTVQPGELFIAIRGPRHDGHDYVAGALAARRCGRGGGAGAACGISRRKSGRNFSPWTTRSPLCSGWPSRACEIWRKAKPGRLIGGRGGVGGQDHHKRNSCGARGRAVPRTENAGKFEQRIWIAADAAATRR